MSASLVGSEMCIRDSSGGPPTTSSTASGASSGPLMIALAAGPGAHCVACLLYTSDAADDM
eukprot:15013568-Alexandrium_andersonii.AAC.1